MSEALREYAATRCPEAFRALVQAHVDLVYSQCLRELRDPAAAEDATQQVFITLAKKAARFSPNVVLDGWLFVTARYCCRNIKRSALRRSLAENKAALMHSESIESAANDDFSVHAQAILDDALSHLAPRDRDALLLRFFQNQPLRQVGEALGVSEDAAKQRVSRAVEKLRHYFARRGITASSAALTGFLATVTRPAPSHAAQYAMQACTTAAHSAGAASMLSHGLTLSKVAALFGLVTTIGIAVSIIYAASAQSNIPAPPANPPAIAAPLAPAHAVVTADVTPATQPLAQATPLGALQKLRDAMAADDHDTIEECVTDDRKDPAAAKLGHATVHEMASVNRLENAWKEKFGQSMKFSDLNFDLFPDGDYETFREVVDVGARLDITFNNDEALVRIPLPPEKFTGTGPDRETAFARWSGAMLVLTQVNGDWKLNTDRSFNFIVSAFRKGGNKTDAMQIVADIEQSIYEALDDTASQIESGKLTSKSQALTTVESRIGKIFRDNKVNGCTYMTLPVIGGGG